MNERTDGKKDEVDMFLKIYKLSKVSQTIEKSHEPPARSVITVIILPAR